MHDALDIKRLCYYLILAAFARDSRYPLFNPRESGYSCVREGNCVIFLILVNIAFIYRRHVDIVDVYFEQQV